MQGLYASIFFVFLTGRYHAVGYYSFTRRSRQGKTVLYGCEEMNKK
jgi:hypothetical protein